MKINGHHYIVHYLHTVIAHGPLYTRRMNPIWSDEGPGYTMRKPLCSIQSLNSPFKEVAWPQTRWPQITQNILGLLIRLWFFQLTYAKCGSLLGIALVTYFRPEVVVKWPFVFTSGNVPVTLALTLRIIRVVEMQSTNTIAGLSSNIGYWGNSNQ